MPFPGSRAARATREKQRKTRETGAVVSRAKLFGLPTSGAVAASNEP